MKISGIGYMVISSLGFAVANTCVKFLDRLPVHEIVFFRSIVSISICLYFVSRLKLPLFGNNKFWLLGRGIFGVTALTLFFFTLKGLPLASAVTIQYLSPVITVLIAIVLLGERVKPIQWLLFTVAFAGIWMIKGPKSTSDQDFYVFLGIMSALTSSIAYNCIIKCRDTDHPVTLVQYFPMVAIPVMGVWCLFDWVSPSWEDWLLLLVLGIVTQIGQVTMTKALHAAAAGRVMPMKYLGAIWGIIIGFFVFDERLSWLTYCGIGLVIGGVVVNTLVTKGTREPRNATRE